VWIKLSTHHVKDYILGNEKDQANAKISTPYISMFQRKDRESIEYWIHTSSFMCAWLQMLEKVVDNEWNNPKNYMMNKTKNK
jgi:hypothetical protein